MEELYKKIEEKIRLAGYTKEVDGREIYEDICDGIEDKDNGAYVFMSKKSDDCFFEYNVQIYDEEFNLSTLTINDNGSVYTVNFDE